jgi:hypothetical protein
MKPTRILLAALLSTAVSATWAGGNAAHDGTAARSDTSATAQDTKSDGTATQAKKARHHKDKADKSNTSARKEANKLDDTGEQPKYPTAERGGQAPTGQTAKPAAQ